MNVWSAHIVVHTFTLTFIFYLNSLLPQHLTDRARGRLDHRVDLVGGDDQRRSERNALIVGARDQPARTGRGLQLAADIQRRIELGLGVNIVDQFDDPGYLPSILSTLRHMPLGAMEQIYREAARSPRPTLLIWGDADAILPVSNARLVCEALPDVQYHAIPGSGHIAHYESPEQVNPLLMAFFKNDGQVDGGEG